MATQLVTYDLNQPRKDYEPLIERIKSLGAWWHYLDSTWLIKTNQSAEQVRNVLRPLIDSDDELLVIDVSGDAAAWAGFDAHGSQWIKDNL